MVNIDKFICSLIKYESYNTVNILNKCLFDQGLKYENNSIKPIKQVQCIKDYIIDNNIFFTKDKCYNIIYHYYFSNKPYESYYKLINDNNLEMTINDTEFKDYFNFKIN